MVPRLNTDCWVCKHRRTIPGNAHIACARPDPEMTGDPYGIKNGWFLYPLIFDPTWRTKECSKFEKQSKNEGEQ